MIANDELRELAARMEGLALDTPGMLREAADAIDVLQESERRLMTQRNERLAKAESENAKLRELVRDMHRGICIAYLRGRPLDPYQYESRMRDLGVEADG